MITKIKDAIIYGTLFGGSIGLSMLAYTLTMLWFGGFE